MSKRLLMLSTAAVALLSGPALATDTTIDSTSGSKSTPYATAAKLTADDSTTVVNANNITIKSGYGINIGGLAQGAITIDSNHWVLNQGTISNKDKDGASAIHVDMSVSPNYTGTSFTTTSGTASVTGIYLDSGSVTSVTGSGKTKYGIYLDNASCAAVCTFTGGITAASGSTLSVTGDSSVALQIGSSGSVSTNYSVVKGDVNIAGTVMATAASTSNSATGMYGLLSYGQIDGNLNLSGSLASYGHGAVGMDIAGMGITGALNITGSLVTSVLNTNTNYNYYSKVNTTTNAEAGSALIIGASIGTAAKGGGVFIGGPTTSSTSTTSASVSTVGESPAILISPSSASITPTGPLYIYTYADSTNPGFSFYNRGSVSAGYTNYNKPTIGMYLSGLGAGYETILTGGMFNSGSLTATAVSSNDASSSTSLSAVALEIGSYVKFLPNEAVKNAAGSDDPGNQAALVISGETGKGTISATVSGTRGGTARAIWIAGSGATSSASGTSVPSLINTGTISAMAATTTASIKGNASGSSDPLLAIAIEDDSGTLASIINSGTISATAGYSASSSGTSLSALDNDSQLAYAIMLKGNTTGTTIKNYATSANNAVIIGDISFGSGDNQVLDLVGTGSKASLVTGNVTYGYSVTTTSIDRLHVGMNAVMTGKVTTLAPYNGVQVDIDTGGTLNLLNTDKALTASTVTVQKNGTLNLGVNRQLTTSGMIAAEQVNFLNGANLNVTYASFLPKSAQASGASYQFVLMTANKGQLSIGQSVITAFNNSIDTNGNSTRPYLLKTATMCNTGNGNCTVPSNIDGTTKDALLIDVQMKTPTEIGLSAGSVAITPLMTDQNKSTTLFEQANLALAVDDTLGSAFLNGVHNAKQAQKAYNDMAPGVTGGTRAIAISITDSATGPVAARQRALRMYGKTSGDFSIWGQEFVQMIKDPGTGAVDVNTGFKTNPGFKDHGFGLSVGIDTGSPKVGWYGGAFTFYAGDVNELSRDAHQDQQWYLLSLYSAWRGKGLFLDTKVDAGYGHIDGKRTLLLQPTSTTYYLREADNKHAGALISGSVVTGAMFSYGAATFMPQVNLDGMYLREEGYTETNPGTTTVGDGFDLKVGQYYAKSLRAFVGLNARYDFKLFDIFLQPEVRAGYRYDFLSDPVKLKAAFAYSDTTAALPAPGATFELTGPDPSQGNFVLGSSLSASTDAWTLGFSFDFVKGSNGVFQQVGTLHVLGRI